MDAAVVAQHQRPYEDIGSAARLVLGRRLLADAIDLALALLLAALGVLGAFLVSVVTSLGGSGLPSAGLALVLLFGGGGVLGALVVLLAGEFTGGGIGRRCARIRLIDATGAPPGRWRGLGRAVIRLFAVSVVLVDQTAGFVILALLLGSALIGPDGRGLHDRLLGTYVVGVEHLDARPAQRPDKVAST